ncbi:hypothetical protein [Lysobacter gummosus]
MSKSTSVALLVSHSSELVPRSMPHRNTGNRQAVLASNRRA